MGGSNVRFCLYKVSPRFIFVWGLDKSVWFCYNIGVMVKELRKKLNLTQKQLGDMIGVSVITVSRWERGVQKPRKLNNQSLIALQERNRQNIFCEIFTNIFKILKG